MTEVIGIDHIYIAASNLSRSEIFYDRVGLTDTFGPARGAPGFWIAAIASLWLVAGLVALYLNAVSRAKG
jgi:hypothetical protein